MRPRDFVSLIRNELVQSLNRWSFGRVRANVQDLRDRAVPPGQRRDTSTDCSVSLHQGTTSIHPVQVDAERDVDRSGWVRRIVPEEDNREQEGI